MSRGRGQRREVRRIRGFTLVEVLIAMTIFAVMSVMAYGGLRTLITARERTEHLSNQLEQLQTAMLLIQQDFQQIVPRSVRDAYGDSEPALTNTSFSGNLIVFTRGGPRSQYQKLRSALQRVAYRLEDETLYRLTWPALDGADEESVRKLALLKGVGDVSFQFLEDNNWGAAWPLTMGKKDDDKLPKAVDMRLSVKQWGELRRVFALPQ